MDSRWMPLFAAAVGVVGGVGGAYIGGVVANEGQEQQSQSQRAAAIQDLRRDAYENFLGTAQELQVAALAGDYSQVELNAIAVRLYVAKTRVGPPPTRPRKAGGAQGSGRTHGPHAQGQSGDKRVPRRGAT